jgi:soluble lytic murein transglycosylase
VVERWAWWIGGVLLAAWAASPLAPSRPGPALRDALALRAAGEAGEAAERFGALAESAPEIADHAAELRIEALVAAAAPEAALAEAAAFRARHADSWLLARVAAHEGAAHVALGDEAAARTAFEEAQARLPERETGERARLLAERAASHERSGDASAAAALWRTLWTRFATSAEASRAEEALARLAATNPGLPPHRTPDAVGERCERLSRALRNDEALAACDAALALAPRERRWLQERADLLFRERRYAEAVTAFAALGSGDANAVFWRGRSLARAGRVEEALASFGALAARSDRELAARARFLAATLHEDSDLAAAVAGYRWVAERAPGAAQRAAARWRLAWLAWRRGDAAGALAGFERFLAEEPDPTEHARGRYWLGRARVRVGDDAGRAGLAQLAAETPLSYYGWRAALHLDGDAPARPDVASGPASVEPKPPPGLPEALLRRLQVLLEAGLDERAVSEIRPLAESAASREARLALAQLLLEAGRFHLAQRLVVDRHAEELARAPAPGAEALWWLAWPTAWDRAVERAASRQGVEPALVYAIMREESGYQPDALSVVGARGLTQIMPDTGRRLATDLGAVGFDPAELFVPERNLELGAFYLGQLLQRFDGRLSAAIASYNAGPEAVARWLAAAPGSADDEWVESIPYDQTRAYVKRVLRSLHVYRVLYGS